MEKGNWIQELILSEKAVCGVCANKKGVGELLLVNGKAIMILCKGCQAHKQRQHGWTYKALSLEDYRAILNENEKK